MPKATKRERQRQNRGIRREAMLAAEKRRKRLRTARTIGLLLVPVVIIFVVIQLVSGDDSDSSSTAAAPIKCSSRKPATPIKTQTFPAAPAVDIDVKQDYTAVMHTSCGDINIELDPKQAPQTVNSFLFLVKSEYYNGTTFHRIVTDFVDQGGDQKGDGTGSPGYTLPDEPPKNGYKAGDVAMANSGANTSGSQFFLVVSQNGAKQLDALGSNPYTFSILGHMDAHGLRVAKKINTFGGTDIAGTPTKTIYLFDVGIIFGNQTTTTTAAPAPAETTTTAAP
ncbi:MAG: peptidylprolyl isomerase [Acidimicrobiia bacterium]